MKYKIIILLVLASISTVSATEINQTETEAVSTEEVVEEEPEDIVITDENAGTENVEEMGIGEGELVVNEGQTLFHVNTTIAEDTTVESEDIFLALYNYDTESTKYVKLSKSEDYNTTTVLNNGNYDASTYRIDGSDQIVFDTPSSFAVDGTEYTMELTIEGATEEEVEDTQITNDMLTNNEEIEVSDTPKDNSNIETSQNTTTQNPIEVEQEQEPEKKGIVDSAFDFIIHIILDNIFILTLMVGSIIGLAIYKNKQNNGGNLK